MERREKLTKSRRSYYDDYKKIATGEYIYTGPKYEFTSKIGKARKRWMFEMLLFDILIFAVILVPGFLNVPGLNYCAYVLLPYVAGILVFGYLFVVLVRLAAAKELVKAWEYDKSIKPMPAATRIGMVVCIASILCETIYLIINGAAGAAINAVVFVVCHIVAAVLAVFMVKSVTNVQWKKKDTDGFKF